MGSQKKWFFPIVLAGLFVVLSACGSSDDTDSSISSGDDTPAEAATAEPEPYQQGGCGEDEYEGWTGECCPYDGSNSNCGVSPCHRIGGSPEWEYDENGECVEITTLPEPDPTPELEPEFIRTNVFLDCSSDEDFCGFDIRLGRPPTDEVRLVIREVQQTTNDEEPLDGCEWASEKKGDVIATFNEHWDVGRGFGLAIAPIEGPLAVRTCTFTFGADGDEDYGSLEPFSYTFIITQPSDEDVVLAAEYFWGPSEEAVALQNVLGIEADGWYGSGTREAHLAALESRGLDTSNVPFPPPTGRIAFVAPVCCQEGWLESDIYTMNADGSDVVQLTDNDSRDQYPVWSPDGSRIAFVSNRSGVSELYVMGADGSNVQQLTDVTQHSEGVQGPPSWSPDSSQIVFSAWALLEGDCHPYFLSYASYIAPDQSLSSIFLIDSDGTNERLIRDRVLGCNEDALDEASCVAAGFSWFKISGYGAWCNGDTYSHLSVQPAWHPDGETIAYMNFAPSYTDFGFDSIPRCFVMLMDLQGNDIELLFNPGENCWGYPGWSLTGILGYGPFKNYLYDRMNYYLITQEDTQVMERSSISFSRGLAWSPDGNSVAYGYADSFIVIDFVDGTEEDIFITSVQGSQLSWKPN